MIFSFFLVNIYIYFTSSNLLNNDISVMFLFTFLMCFFQIKIFKFHLYLNNQNFQDLFTQAEFFAEDANKLYKLVRQFSYQVSYVCVYFLKYFPIHVMILTSVISCHRFQVVLTKMSYQNFQIKFLLLCNNFSLL